MADTWEPADAVVKNDAGEMLARFGDKWEPVTQAAKNDAGQYVVLRSAPGLGARMNTATDQALRAPGLALRAGLRGAAGVAQMLAEPLRLPLSVGLQAAGLRDSPILTGTELADVAADKTGLPAPETFWEKVGSKGAEVLAGAALPMGVASQFAGASAAPARVANGLEAAQAAQVVPTAREVIRQFVANPGTQLAGAAGAGAAGEYVKETGGDPLSQLLASVAGGVAAGSAVNLGERGINAGRDIVRNLRMPPTGTIQIDATIQNILGPGVDWTALPQHVKNQMRNDVQEALKQGPLTPDRVRRLADYRLSGATPSRAGITLDPVDITQQRNLSKQGANSKDASVQLLARLENDNAKTLARGVSELGGEVVDDAFVNSAKAVEALKAVDEARRSRVGELYKSARDSLGRAAPLDPAAATQTAGLALAEAQAGGSLPAAARSMLNDVATGKIPFNVDTKEQMVRVLGEMARGGSVNGAERTALNIVRKALDDAPLLETHGLGPDALAAFRAARTAHAERLAKQEAIPALKAVVEGMEPDKFFQQFVAGGKVRELAKLRDEIGAGSEAWRGMRGQLVAYLKQKGNVSEDAGTFNSASFNNALKSLGNEKLKVFFSPEEVAQLQAIGRVARYEQVQPRGSAVNNANTAGAMVGFFERLANSSAITGVPLIGDTLGAAVKRGAGNAALRIRAGQSSDVPSALAIPATKATEGPMLSPALAALLASPRDKREEKR